MATKQDQELNNDEFTQWLDEPTPEQAPKPLKPFVPKPLKSREEVKKKQAENISKAKRAQASEKRAKTQTSRLTPRERRFCQRYVETGKAGQSVVDAGYNVSNLNSAGVLASDLLKKPIVQQEILRLQQPGEDKAIATSREVMQRLTAIARGEEKDQFGLEISAGDRIKALIELAKRTVDIENRLKPTLEDNTIHIKLDWEQKEE